MQARRAAVVAARGKVLMTMHGCDSCEHCGNWASRRKVLMRMHVCDSCVHSSVQSRQAANAAGRRKVLMGTGICGSCVHPSVQNPSSGGSGRSRQALARAAPAERLFDRAVTKLNRTRSCRTRRRQPSRRELIWPGRCPVALGQRDCASPAPTRPSDLTHSLAWAARVERLPRLAISERGRGASTTCEAFGIGPQRHI